MRGWPAYAPTPLARLPEFAERLGVAEVRAKDETGRFGIGSFKATGGAYAVLRVLQSEIRRTTGHTPTTRDFLDHRVSEAAAITTVTASAGNHGRSVAWGSQLFGCRCVVVLPQGADRTRAEAIESHGATVEWYRGDYDGAVAHVERIARERGWFVVSDTAYAGYEEIPRRVYEGYTLLADEVLQALDSEGSDRPTHVFIQAGVGGLATGVCGHLWQELGEDRPDFVAIEPLSADCFGRSIRAGDMSTVDGPFDTRMGGLAAGVPSTITWEVLGGCIDGAIAIADSVSDAAAAELNAGSLGATLLAGPSGAAGVGALLALTRLPSARRLLGLSSESRVLTLVTETKF
jgi:diaminopropionate ammonia-lyase